MTIHDQIQTEQNCLILIPIQILGIDTIQTIDHETHHTIETETIQTIEIEVIQIIEINVTKTVDSEIINTKDPVINEQIIKTTIIDHEIIHKIGIHTIAIKRGFILNLLMETTIINMITAENDYEPIIYENIFTSHIYENQLELLHNYYTKPNRNNVPNGQEVNRINTVIKPEIDEVQSSSTNQIYQNIQKEQP